jgi:medium-chain acyl-[acyl-carrier-protein] hydrolase
MSNWYTPRDAATPNLRLLCVPFAGGGAGIYRGWPDAMPPGVDVVALALPGRERRLRETPYTAMSALLRDLVPAIRPLLDVPWAIFGHSMGAAIAYEIARATTLAGNGPEALLVSARRAPQLPPPHPPMFSLPRDTLIAEVQRLYGPFPKAILEHRSLLDMFLPTMRADFQLLDTWQAPVDCVLDTPITALAAEGDHAVLPETIPRWGELTRGPFQAITVPGGHFCVRDRTEVRDHVARIVAGLAH